MKQQVRMVSMKQQVRMMRNREKTAKTSLTRARKQLVDLVDKKDRGLDSLATKTEIGKAILKVESEYNIIIKLIYNLKEIITLEDGDERTDIDRANETLIKEVD